MADAFDTLGLAARFDLSEEEMQRAYLERSGTLHPDVARGDVDAARGMAALNGARRVLSDPERRADALLVRLGGPSRREERGLPEGFLMEIMEVREGVEAALAEKDAGKREPERRKWEAWAESERGRAVAEVGEMFRRGAGLREIRVRLNAWRYIERLIEQLDPGYDPNRADFE